jgi:P2-related tail formation protein
MATIVRGSSAHLAILREKQLKDRLKKCRDTGMPEELVAECVKLLKLGVPMSKVMTQLQSEAAAAQAAAQSASVQSAAQSAVVPVVAVAKTRNTKKMLIIGGVAAGGALALFLLLRKNR